METKIFVRTSNIRSDAEKYVKERNKFFTLLFSVKSWNDTEKEVFDDFVSFVLSAEDSIISKCDEKNLVMDILYEYAPCILKKTRPTKNLNVDKVFELTLTLTKFLDFFEKYSENFQTVKKTVYSVGKTITNSIN